MDFRLSLAISMKSPSTSAIEKGHVAITHMKAGRYYNGRAKGKLKSFGSSGRSLPFLSLGTHHEQHPPKTDTSHRGQKIPKFQLKYLYFVCLLIA